ncbi:hypothetical protein CRM22_009830 [Opisthorchis felineus]|uniref:Uncharacterized protein n=1 Tax=Opisthorchis felineus TaxID=147828 RepID=A0A4S2L4E7_OPIFE|nr:hypothetical protein CRM22_009830 [Opisthorchis felineus]
MQLTLGSKTIRQLSFSRMVVASLLQGCIPVWIPFPNLVAERGKHINIGDHYLRRLLAVDPGDCGYGLSDSVDKAIDFLGTKDQPAAHMVISRQFVKHRGWQLFAALGNSGPYSPSCLQASLFIFDEIYILSSWITGYFLKIAVFC